MFPVSPVNGETTIVNGILYKYIESGTGSGTWVKAGESVGYFNVNINPETTDGEIQIIRGSLQSEGGGWKYYELAGLASEGIINRVIVTGKANQDSSTMNISFSDHEGLDSTSTILKYEEVPSAEYRLDSSETIQYNGKLYFGIYFDSGETNTIHFRIDVRTKGTNQIVSTYSKYRTIPYVDNVLIPEFTTGPLHTLDLSNQIDGVTGIFTLPLDMVPASLIVIHNGMTLLKSTSDSSGDYIFNVQGRTITFSHPLVLDDILQIIYNSV